MTRIREMLSSTTYVDDDGDIKPYADIAPGQDSIPATNAFIAQGMANLKALRREQDIVDEGEALLRRERERAVAAKALEHAGIYVTLDEHRQNQLQLIDIASDISMYRGGEKGGYATEEFRNRYEPQAGTVVKGARANHLKRVNQDIPRIYKAAELEAAGFSAYDIQDDITQMRSELMSRYGGPANKKARAERRASLKKQ